MRTIDCLCVVLAMAWCGLAAAQQISLESAPPVVVRTTPTAGAEDVDPSLKEIRVTFSKPMADGTWSWSTWGEENFPKTSGAPRYLDDQRTCVLPVTLEPQKFYAIWLNSDRFTNFKDAGGRSAVPYLLTFTTGAAGRQSLDPDEVTALPGELLFHGRYQHRSRGQEIETPSELWVKQAGDGGLQVLAHLPFMGTSELVTSDGRYRITDHRITGVPTGGRPGYSMVLEFGDDVAKLTRRGVRENVDGRELQIPAGAWFDPNTRPDSYAAANILLRAFDLPEGQTKEFHVFDWDNSGEKLVEYTISVAHHGKQTVDVPAGTFQANHLVLTQRTSADTWFKKRAGHVTEFWVLDNHAIVRVLRHREPYEMLLMNRLFQKEQ